eukprot:SAG22_NODE_1266_length_4956_cov_3.272184_2_plen_75_part_00
MYHPQIDEHGTICLPVLKEWSPACTIVKVLDQILSIMKDPNPDTPVNGDIAKQYKEDLPAYKATVKKYTADYAK